MLTNYLKIAWRNLLRNKAYSIINIVCLALGLSCSLAIGLWVQDELSFNKSYPNADRIFYVLAANETATNTVTPGPLADALKRDVPEVEKAAKFLAWSSDVLLEAGEKSGKEEGMFVSSDFLSIFQYKMLQGSPKATELPANTIVITRTVVEKYFGRLDVVGQTLQLNDYKYYQVGAVIEDVPKNSTIQFSWLVNLEGVEEDWMTTWGNYSFHTYVKLQPNSSQAKAEAKMKGLMKKYSTETTDAVVLQSLGDTYLYGEYENGKPAGGRISYVRTFGVVALLILLIACVNFMNLATARSTSRAKEVGIRKAVGARRASLVGQFLGESALLSLLAALLAVGIVSSALPALNQWVGKSLALDFSNPFFWAILLGLTALTSLIAGSYPALFLSAMKPVRILKKATAARSDGFLLRKSLVIFQFSLAVFLIVGMLVIGQQMHFVRTQKLGLDRENVIQVPVEGDLSAKMETFRQELQSTSAISSVTTSGELPINFRTSTTGSLSWPGKDPKNEVTVYTSKVGYDFAKTMNIRLLAGRDFSPADSGAYYLVNESAVKLMNLKNPLDTEIGFQIGKGHIVGVMQDFHTSSFHEPIRPVVLSLYPKWTNFFLIRTQPGQTAAALAAVERVAKELNPAYPFTYHFLDEEFEKLYRSETMANTLINCFGLLAILISCLGLFGLATFTAEQRTKEIGVRKVLGASVASIVDLLSKDFVKLVLIAIIIASPIAWYVMNAWLADFAYKIDIAWWYFALAGGLAVGIALLTVSFQSVRAALANPVDSLRSE